MVKLRERFSVLGIILVGFLMGAMFVAGGVSAYTFYFPKTVVAQDTESSGKIEIGPSNISQTVNKVSPAVVNIETVVTSTSSNPYLNDPFFKEYFGNHYNIVPQAQTSTSVGTGFIFDKSGLIITNEHVIDGASEINVTISGMDDPVKAKVVGYDKDLDLAVIKVSVDKDLPVLTLGDSTKTEVGDWVIAIGSPYGLDHTVTVGVISAKGRPVTISDRLYKNLLQTDAAINPGNSGGPLMNTNGEVIGINTAVNASAQGIGFAIPTSTVKDVINDLVTKGKVVKSYIGVYMQSLDERTAEYLGASSTDGALVAKLADNGPAAKAGLQVGDIIISANNKKIKTPDDLSEIINDTKIGNKLTLEVYRSKQAKTITVTTAEKP